MPLFSIPELREEARKNRNEITIAISRSNLGVGDATFHLDAWAQELIIYARSLGYSVIDINGPDMVYERFTEILQNTKPAILFNFSHGCQNYLVGNDLRCTLARGKEWEQVHPDQFACGVCGMPGNLKAIKDTAVIAYSCHSGAQLGKCAIKYGAPAYVGWSDSLILVSDRYGTQNIFREALIPMARRVLQGYPIGLAVEQTRTDLYNLAKQYKPVELIATGLWYDKKYLTMWGDPDWGLSELPPDKSGGNTSMLVTASPLSLTVQKMSCNLQVV